MSTSTNATLWYGNVLIGNLINIVCSDETWWATIIRATSRDQVLPKRLESFIALCEDWNERTRTNHDDPPSAAEFDQFADVLKSGLWLVEMPAGGKERISDAPVFYSGGECSWRFENAPGNT
jgi:hypothetical protein